MFRSHEGGCAAGRDLFFAIPVLHLFLNSRCHGHECRIVFSWAMAVASCVVVVDLPVGQVFLLQVVHCIAAWLGLQACYPVLRHASRRSGYFHTRRIQGEAPEGALRSQKEAAFLILGGRILARFFSFFAKSPRAGKK